MYFCKEMTAAYYDCDCNNRLKISAAMRYMQQTSGEQLVSMEMSAEKLYSENMVFLLSEMNARFYRMPDCMEELRVGTAPVGVKGARFIREFVMDTMKGERLISAVSLWILADVQSHKIIRPSNFPYSLDFQQPGLESESGSAKIPKAVSEVIGSFQQVIRYSHVDVNNHVNNSYYSDFVCDALPSQRIMTEQPRRIAIKFQNEAKHGDTLRVETAQANPDSYKVAGTHDGSPCFEAYVEF